MGGMNYKAYTARVEFDEHDGIFWGKVLGLAAKENITFEGDTVTQLTQDFHHAIDFYLADCANTGRQPLKPASGKLLLRVDPQVHGAALIAAKASGQSPNQWAAAALAQAAHV